MISDEFLTAVKDDLDWKFIAPHTQEVVQVLKARDIWQQICESAHKTGDPGVIFIDRVAETDPCPELGPIHCSNPCVVGTELIMTPLGPRDAESIYKEHAGSVLDSKGHVRAISEYHDNGVQNVYKVTLQNGISTTVTADHRFTLADGTDRKCHVLKVGDELKELPTFKLAKRSLAYWVRNNVPVTSANHLVQLSKLPTEWNTDLAYFMGYLIGDGFVADRRNAHGWIHKVHMVTVPGRKGEKALKILESLTSNAIQKAVSETGTVEVSTDSVVLTKWLIALDFPTTSAEHKHIPKSIWTAPKEMQVAFLAGLYDADGSRYELQNYRATYHSADLVNTKHVCMLLKHLGLNAKLRSKEQHTEFDHGEKHYEYDNIEFTVSISQADLTVLPLFQLDSEVFGAWKPERQRTNTSTANLRNDTTVASIIAVGKERVYDFTIPDDHHYLTPAGVNHNCGEQMLREYENCTLGSLNLSSYVNDQKFNYGLYQQDISHGIRFLDDAVDTNYFPLPELREANSNVRRIGLGVMGWADCLFKMQIPYNSPEALLLANELSGLLNITSWCTSAKLAEEKGPFPEFEKSALKAKGQLPVRNCSVTSIQPTGSTARLANCSFSIEPYFAIAYYSNILWTSHHVGNSQRFLDYPEPLFEYMDNHYGGIKAREILTSIANSPDVGYQLQRDIPWLQTAHELPGNVHLAHQIAWQKGISNSVSKTINLPNNASIETVKELFLQAHKEGLKAVTIYRDGSKSAQVLETGKSKEHQGEQHVHLNGHDSSSPNLTTNSNGHDTAHEPINRNHPNSNQQLQLPSIRPEVLTGTTQKILTGHGNLYVTINSNNEDKPQEVFITLGKNGGCVQSFVEAIGRLISVSLQHGVPLTALTEQLQGIQCAHPSLIPNGKVLSVPDGVSVALANISNNNNLTVIEDNNNKSLPPVPITLDNSINSVMVDYDLSSNNTINDNSSKGLLCTSCGSLLVMSGGKCLTCSSCGTSTC